MLVTFLHKVIQIILRLFMPLASNRDKVAFASQYPIDKILDTFSGSFIAAAGSSGAARGTLQQIGSIDPKYTPANFFSQMIWSDDGVNWFPGGNPHNTLNSYNLNGQELTVISVLGFDSVYAYGLNQRTNNVTIQYKVAVFDRSNA